MLATLILGVAAAAGPGTGAVTAVVLGTAQDGGIPQANCRCRHCATARADPARRRSVASLALLDRISGETFLIDATPDLPVQLDRLIDDPELPLRPGRNPLDGILLTHAHIGHYAGLIHFGREVLGSRSLPVYASERMSAFLEQNAPWSQLVALGQICLVRTAPGARLQLTPRIAVTPLPVPHRDELSDTVAWLVEGPEKRLLWLPDIDGWSRWERPIEEVLATVDYAFLDATFASAAELPGRSLAEIPHPLVSDTIGRLGPGREERRARGARVFLVHFNHSNPLVAPDDDAAHAAVAAAGLELAAEGQRLGL